MKKIIYLFILVYFFPGNLSAQTERYTKGAENGYAWLAMEASQIPYNNSKYNYLSGILDKNKMLKNKFPGSKSLLCNNEIIELLEKGDSESFSLEEVVREIDNFYSTGNNLVIPIVFSYCYVIKKEAGQTQNELNNYIEEVLEFCKE